MTDGRVRAPALEGVAWINADRPLSWRDLRGHVVVLDFWTHCCINCLHVLPDLASLEERFRDRPFVVIGVHSAKFDAEREVESVRDAVRRHHVRHPVVVDSKREIWSEYGVRAWPTILLVDAEGYVVGGASGEPDPAKLADAVEALLEEARAKGTLAKERFVARGEGGAARVAREGALPIEGLSYPGKVASDGGARLAIADTGNDRVLVTDESGTILDVIGAGARAAGARDGAFETCGLRAPQGLCFAGDVLWIADTGNHLVRRADLRARTVTTALGSGRRGAGPPRDVDDPRAIDLRSPWDVLFLDGLLFIAMAGDHRIWALEIDGGSQFGPWAGSGHEARIDADRTKACFAQPSGLASDGTTLWVADSESSSIRAIDLDGDRVTTVVGAGGLFDWGDSHHPDEPCLQHPLGVAYAGGALLIADTFNGKVKRFDLGTRLLTTVATGLREPGGVAPGWVAETNAHTVVRLKT